jgi:hypothetical protein
MRPFHFANRPALTPILMGLALVPRVAHAALVADENFNYSGGAALDTQAGGIGFSGPWNTGNGNALPAAPGARTIQPGTLGFGTTGNHVFIDTGGENDRNLASSLGTPGTTDYFSFTLMPDSAIDPNTSAGLILGGSTTRVFFGKPSVGANTDYTIEIAGGANQQDSGVPAVQDVPVFLVVQAEFESGDGTILDLYVNPTPGAPQPAVANATLSDVDIGSLTYLGVNSFGPVSTPLVTGMDSSLGEIRIGTTFADVTPVPEPSAISLLAIGVAALCRRRSRPASSSHIQSTC